MRRILATSVISLVVFIFPAAAQAQLSHRDTTAYGRAYVHVKAMFGVRIAGCKLIGPHRSCHGRSTDARILHSTDVLRRMVAPKPTYRSVVHYVQRYAHYRSVGRTVIASATSYNIASTGTGSGGYCGAYQFDQGTWTSVGMPGSPCGASAGMQDQAAARLKAQRGLEPWPKCGVRYYSGGWAAVRQCENSGSYAP